MAFQSGGDGPDGTGFSRRPAPGSVISHYRIEKKIGGGGMGEVYLAEDTKLHRRVALKFLPAQYASDPELKARFTREAQAAACLSHPNIVTIHEVSEYQEKPFIVMEFVEGESIRDLVSKRLLPVDQVLDIAVQIGEGLAKAHKMGIIHRDVKSQNILIDKEDRARILDFGLAKVKKDSMLTQSGVPMGTVAYMSPEQARGAEVDHRTDIWSLGVVLYEMLTGQMPFKGEHDQAVIHSILNAEPVHIGSLREEIPKSLTKTVARSLCKAPAQRYQSMEELLIDLREVRKDLEVTEAAPPRRRKARKRRNAVIVSAAALLAAVLALVFLPHPEQPVPVETFKIPVGVTSFDNQTGEAKYDYLRKVLADMLITDLSRSKYVQVMTNERMFDLAKSLGHEQVEIIDAPLGFELCKLAGAHAMVLGSLTRSGDVFVINAQVLNVDTKKQIAACRVTGRGEDSILGNLVDDLTDEIKKGMEVSIREIQYEKTSITELTTTSLEAYKHYFSGIEAAYRMDHQEAIDNLEKAVTLDSTFVEAYKRLARQYYEIKERDRALLVLQKIESFSPQLTEEKSLEILALEAYIGRDWDLAVSHLKRLTSINPQNIRAHIDLGMAYKEKTMYDEGISQFRKALELDPQGVNHQTSFTYNVLGWTYLRKGELQKAQAAFEQYVALLPNQSNPLNCLGEFYLTVGNYDRAAATFLRSLEVESDLAVTHGDLGDACFAKGMYSQALVSYRKYVALSFSKVEQAHGRFLLGRLCYFMGDYAKAVEEGHRASELDPSMIEARWILGLSLLEQEMFDQAESEALTISELIKDMRSEEDKAYYYHLLGESSLRQNLHSQALEYFGKAAKIRSLDRPFFVNALGEACLRIGDLDKAIENFESALKMNPNYAQAHYLCALAFEKKGRKEKARQHLQEFVAIWRDADTNLPELVEARKLLEEL
jgi:serine/threonine protein kinase/tetratricopeptide (TPR) repeat protein